jgi:cytochrome P450
LKEDFEGRIGPAIEEFVRWASPVMQFARFATEYTESAGQTIKAGDKVALFHCSANRICCTAASSTASSGFRRMSSSQRSET